MSEKGHTLLEVLISLSLLFVMVSFFNQGVVELERIHQENLIYHQVLLLMQEQVDEWRHFEEKEDETLFVGHTKVNQKIEVENYRDSIERANFTFTWSFGNKEWETTWTIDRFHPTVMEDVYAKP